MPADPLPATAQPERLLPAAILRALRCPVCAGELMQNPGRLTCPAGHSFDRARQGHVTLGHGHRATANADSPTMIAARARLLGSGLFDPIRQALAGLIAAQLPRRARPLVADLAGGTGYYLAGVLDRLPLALGVCVDLSTPALKRAARCHPRARAIGSDLREPLPLADGVADVVMNVFGPRPIAEITRVLAPGGILAVVTPTTRHLAELVERLGMVTVDPRKKERLATSLRSFDRVAGECIEFAEPIDQGQARALVTMGPSAHHVTQERLEAGLAALGDATPITVSVNLGIYRPTPAAGGRPDVVLRRCFSNPSKPLRSLISRVHKASLPRGADRPATQRADTRGPVVEKARQSQTRLNASNRAALLDSYAAEVPVQELADRFGVHRSTVSELMRRASVPARSPGLPESIRREAARLYEEGLTLPQVAARLGISNDGARAGIVACGGTIRPRGRQPARK